MGYLFESQPLEQIACERRVDEYESLLFHAKSSRSRFMYPLIILAVETGMRLGELLKLEWNDFDEEGCLLTLKDTKNGESRVVPVSMTAFDTLIATCK